MDPPTLPPSVGASAAPVSAASASTPVATTLDRSQFARTLSLAALRVPTSATSNLVRVLRGSLLDLPKVRPVVAPPDDPSYRLLLLPPGCGVVRPNSATPAADASSQPPTLLTSVADLPLLHSQLDALAAAGATIVPASVTTGYEHLSVEEVLRTLLSSVLKPGEEPPTSYEQVGHVAHLNLKDAFLPWAGVIGQVMLDKNAVLRTVVNKTGMIDTVFRTFPMEVVAGEDDTVVEVKHAGGKFRFDFRTVYWNSRLCTEHAHVATVLIPPRSIVADMFAGVGPFAVPLALPPRNCTVHANDLNPASHAALVANTALNKVEHRVKATCLDAREFITRLVRIQHVPVTHILMNLPADAMSFCDVFVGLWGGGGPNSPLSRLPMPLVVVYTFSAHADSWEAAQEDVAARLLSVLGLPGAGEGGAHAFALSGPLPTLRMRYVRLVAPYKIMVAAEFVVPEGVARRAPTPGEEGGVVTEPDAKRPRMGGE